MALTGGGARLDAAVALFENGVGKRLLISGVNQETTKDESEEARRMAGARFDCCADIGYAAEDHPRQCARSRRLGATRTTIRSLLIVTARYPHAAQPVRILGRRCRTSRWCLIPVDPEDSIDLEGWWSNPRTLRVLHCEYAKYLGRLS